MKINVSHHLLRLLPQKLPRLLGVDTASVLLKLGGGRNAAADGAASVNLSHHLVTALHAAELGHAPGSEVADGAAHVARLAGTAGIEGRADCREERQSQYSKR